MTKAIHPSVQIVERNLPLVAIHSSALDAAEAAECSADVGAYDAMRQVMFARQGLVEDGDWGLLAAKAGIKDTSALLRCIASGRHRNVIDADVAAAGKAGVTGTPGVLVNGYVHQGAVSLEQLEARLAVR